MKRKKPKPLGQQVAEARHAAGLTQTELANRIGGGTCQQNVSELEAGLRDPTDSRSVLFLMRVADALEKSLLVDGTGARLVDPHTIDYPKRPGSRR